MNTVTHSLRFDKPRDPKPDRALFLRTRKLWSQKTRN